MSVLPATYSHLAAVARLRAGTGIPLLAGAFAFGLYFRTAARTITWAHGAADGAELSAVAATLGIAHPPGYPLYTLLGYLYTLVPAGEVAFRVALFSATAGAAGAALAAVCVLRLEWQPVRSSSESYVPSTAIVGAAAAGLALTTAPMYWAQSTVPEVMALSALFVMGLLSLLFLWRPGRDGILVAAVFVLGLGLAHHVTIIFLGGLCALYVTATDPGWVRRRAAPLALAAGLTGLSFYLYLPLRASADPQLNWGDPSTLPRFVEHVTARSYQSYLGGRPLAAVLARIPVVARLLIDQFTWPGLVLAMLGLSELSRRCKGIALVLVAYVTITIVFTVLYFTREGEGYVLPVVLVFAVCLGVGVAYIARARLGLSLAVAAMVAIPSWQVWSAGAQMDVSGSRDAAAYARGALSSASPGSVIFTQDDDHTFALWYVQAVEGLRPDVVVVDRRALALDWYREQMERRHPGLLAKPEP